MQAVRRNRYAPRSQDNLLKICIYNVCTYSSSFLHNLRLQICLLFVRLFKVKKAEYTSISAQAADSLTDCHVLCRFVLVLKFFAD